MRRLTRAMLAVTLAASSGAALAQADEEPLTAGSGQFLNAALANCTTDLKLLNQMFGWQVRWPREWAEIEESSEPELRRAIARWTNAPAALAADEARLRASIAAGGTAPRVVVERVLEQLAVLENELATSPPPSAASTPLQRDWRELVSARIAPPIRKYAAFLRIEYLPRASNTAGLGAAAGGEQCFRGVVRHFTSLDIAPAEIERIGRKILRATNRDLAKLHGVPPARVPKLLEQLRNRRTPGFTGDTLLRRSEAALARAEQAMPRLFKRPVVKPLTVRAMAEAMQDSFPAGYYEQGSGGAPATVVINLSRPQERELMAEVIAFHEGLPGHHIRVALGYPAGTFNSGFAEGWALYSEYLADEAGLYSGTIDRTGMMTKHLWAASRLIVEPGLHLHGWSRDQAIDFMLANTALSRSEIELEVDRYIAMPGQSLSYILGYDRIAGARAYAENKLGKRFDLREFHEIVLGPGARPLDDMVEDVKRWADKQAALKA